MKFLYYGSFGPHNTESYISYALERLGHLVVQASKDTYTTQKVVQEMKKDQYDVLLFAKAPTDFVNAIDEAQKAGTKSVCWLFDLYWGWRDNVKDQSMWRADHVFTTDGGHDHKWRKIGARHRTLRQGIHDPEYKYFARYETVDVGFVGSLHYPYRHELIKFLKNNYKFELIQGVRGFDLNKRLADIKIIVGDSVPSPNYWSNRVYEVTGRGGFLIHPEVDGFDNEFQSVPTFPHGDFERLSDLIGNYLTNDSARHDLRKQQFGS